MFELIFSLSNTGESAERVTLMHFGFVMALAPEFAPKEESLASVPPGWGTEATNLGVVSHGSVSDASGAGI